MLEINFSNLIDYFLLLLQSNNLYFKKTLNSLREKKYFVLIAVKQKANKI
jgi:hypothetical protein